MVNINESYGLGQLVGKYDASRNYQKWAYETYNKMTGLGCAKWLVEHCHTYNLKLPKYYCHSANPVGKDWIYNCLDSYNNPLP